jgi:hypothetical protein
MVVTLLCLYIIIDITTLMCRLSRNPGALTSRTSQGHVGLFRGYFTCSHGKAISISQTECVVVLVIKHAMRMRHIFICALSHATVFVHSTS